MTRRVHYGDSARWCLKPVTYKHLGGLRRRCRKPKYHQGACWGGIPVDAMITEEQYKNYLFREDDRKREELKKLSLERMDLRAKLRAERKRSKLLSRWLSEARHQLWSEYMAAGGDEEAGNNASLRARGKTIERIDKVLEETR